MADKQIQQLNEFETLESDDKYIVSDASDTTEAKYITKENAMDGFATDAELALKADKDNVLELDNTDAFTPDSDYEPATKKYVDDSTPALGTDDITNDSTVTGATASNALNTLDTDKAEKANVLGLDNTTTFTPDADYEPATKKYVDDATPALDLDDLADVDAPTPSEGDVIAWNDTSSAWEQTAQSGGGANLFIFDETPTETPNGTITNFSTTDAFASGKIEVFKNGVRMTETDDYTEDSDKLGITFVTAPATGTKIRVNYLRSSQVSIGSSGTVYAETPTGDVDGSNTAYDTAHTFIAGTIRVVLNGVLQTLTDDYAETDTDTITFVTAPHTGDTLRVYYDRTLPSAGNASQLDGNTLTQLQDMFNPIGTIKEYNVATNPATLLGFGTWAAHGTGRVTVAIDSGDTDFDTVGEERGSKTHTLTTAEMPTHDHEMTALNVQSGTGAEVVKQYDGSYLRNTSNKGSGTAHNNIQPSIVVYRWVRTA